MKRFMRISFLPILFFLVSCSQEINKIGPVSTKELLPYPVPQQDLYGKGYPIPGQESPTLIPTSQLPPLPDNPHQPQKGLASISGTLFSFTIWNPLAKTDFYLTRGWGKEEKDPPPVLSGPNDKKGDISSNTNEKGQFFLDNLPPGNYYIGVQAPYNWSMGVVSNKDFSPRLIILKEGDQINLGLVYVSWP